jgi:hypothetical protein
MNQVEIPENWDEEVIEVSKPKKNKWIERYPEMAERCPALLNYMKKTTKTDKMIKPSEIICDHLEAVSLWKPVKSSVGIKEIENKERDNREYKLLYEQWLSLIERVGLKENSSIIERTKVEKTLSVYCHRTFKRDKFVHMKNNSSGIVVNMNDYSF